MIFGHGRVCPGYPHEGANGYNPTDRAARLYPLALVLAERHDDIVVAIQRETSIKRWPREWKVNLIIKENPAWDDLYPQLL